MKKFFGKFLFYIMILIYILVVTLLSPVFIIILFFIKDLKKGLLNRFIPFKFRKDKKIIVHASSTGEAILAYNLFEDRANYTYFNQGAFEIFSQKKVESYPLPFESILAILLFITLNNYSTIVILEQEIWPAFIFLNRLFKKKILLLNCNMYEKSFQFQRKFKFLFSGLFSLFDEIIAKSNLDMEKILYFTKKINVKNLENFKILSSFKNLTIDENNLDNQKIQTCTDKKKIILFSSFHQQEFYIASEIIKEIKNRKFINKEFDSNRVKYIIAPRHLEKIKYLLDEFKNSKISYDLLSNYIQNNENKLDENSNKINTEKLDDLKLLIRNIQEGLFEKDILIIDKYGFLSYIYGYCIVSIIGGSFNNKGGQNFIESVMHKVPVIIGPSYENFQDLMEQFSGPWLKIIENFKDEKELISLIINFLTQLFDKDNQIIYDKLESKILQLKKIAEKQNEYILNFI